MKHLFLFSLFTIYILSVFSQTKDLGLPKTIQYKALRTNLFVTQPSINRIQEMEKDTVDSFNKVYRFGVEQAVSIDIFESAEKTILSNGDALYQLGIYCPNAVSVNLLFDQFELSKGTKMYLVSNHTYDYIGAYTSLNNNVSKQLGTDIVYDNKVIIEIVVPKNTVNKSFLHLATVVSGYRDLDEIVGKVLGQSGSCHYDVNCPLGAGWESQRNSVAVVISGGSICSGALIANTSGRVIPYYLTANHCGTSNVGTSLYRFRWERDVANTICAAANSTANNGPTTMTINGSVLRATNTGSDFMLVELNALPDPAWGVYYSGWNRSEELTITKSTGIHHPNGDIKKITLNEDALTQSTGTLNGIPGIKFWRVNDWEFGATESGSSGSPLFDQNKRIVGQLGGGNSACSGTNPNNQFDVYGRFGISWDEGTTPATRLKDWLDSAGINPVVWDGYAPEELATNEISDNLKSEIAVFPNPANDFIQINSTNGTLLELVEIYDLSGKIVLEKELNELQNTIQTVDLKGFYFVKIQTNKGVLVSKILIN